MSPVAINGIDKQGVSVNGIQVKQALNADNETVDKGVYAATTLSAVDAELAVGNIKDGVTIFGFLGTLAPGALAVDVTSNTGAPPILQDGDTLSYYKNYTVTAGNDLDVISKTDTYDADSIAVASGYISFLQVASYFIKVRLYMDGTQVAESAYPDATHSTFQLIGTRALSGSKICKIAIHNYDGSDKTTTVQQGTPNSNPAIGILIGSIKLA